MSFSFRLLQNSSGSASVPPRFRAGRPEPQLRQGCRNSTRLPTKTDWLRPRFRLGSASVPCGSTIFFTSHNAFSLKPRNEAMNGSICQAHCPPGMDAHIVRVIAGLPRRSRHDWLKGTTWAKALPTMHHCGLDPPSNV